jgi:hypothetical protein
LELFFSESGAGRVVRVAADKQDEVTAVVTGFPRAPWSSDPGRQVGPLGLAFITRTKLAVGTGGLGLGEDLIRVYALPADAVALEYDQADHSVGPVPADSRSETGEGGFLSLATIEEEIEKALFAASSGDDAEGWILKAALGGNRLSDLRPFIATRRVAGAAAPTSVTINPKPRAHYLVVGQMGEAGDDRDSRITFYGPATGAMALNLNAGLYDVCGLAYSRPSGDLYAIDFAWANPEAGGVYRIESAEVDGRESCRAVKIASVRRPTSLAFAPDGALYVTAFGERADADSPPTGTLVKIVPGLSASKL